MVQRPPHLSVSPSPTSTRRRIIPEHRYDDNHNKSKSNSSSSSNYAHSDTPTPTRKLCWNHVKEQLHQSDNDEEFHHMAASPPRRLLTSTATPTPPNIHKHHPSSPLQSPRAQPPPDVGELPPFPGSSFPQLPILQSPKKKHSIPLHRTSPLQSPRSFSNYGLLITLEQPQGGIAEAGAAPSDNSTLTIQFCPDHNFRDIHPNSYAPACFKEVQKLGGGGSGVAVFGGHHPRLGNVVMKHGSDKDLSELFALATVTQELQDRGTSKLAGGIDVNVVNQRAARHLQQRIPEFRMIYISPHHLGEKRKELWQRLRTLRKVSGTIMLLPIEEEESSDDSDKEGGAGDSISTSTSTTFPFYCDVDSTAASTTASTSGSDLMSMNHTTTSTTNNNNVLGEPLNGEQHRHGSSPRLRKSTSGHKTVTIMEDKPITEDDAAIFEMDQQPVVPQQQPGDETEDEDELEAEENFRLLKRCSQNTLFSRDSSDSLPAGVEISKSGTVSGHRDIALVVVDSNNPKDSKEQYPSLSLLGDTLTVTLPDGQYEYHENHDNGHTSLIQVKGDGYAALKSIYEDLLVLMKDHRWKFTFGQKRIGGEHPQTGNLWLYHHQLKGKLLDFLVTQNVQLVRDLVSLTTPREQDPSVLEEIRDEVKSWKQKQQQQQGGGNKASCCVEASDLSKQADAFVGSAIIKNFKAETGRFPVLIRLGERFREHSQEEQWNPFLNFASPPSSTDKGRSRAMNKHLQSSSINSNKASSSLRGSGTGRLILTPEEEIPAYHLGCLTRCGALLGDTFENAPREPIVLERILDSEYWQGLMEIAVRESAAEQEYNEQHQQQQQHQQHQQQLTLSRGHYRRPSLSYSNNSVSMATKRLWTCGLTDAGLHNLFLAPDRLWLFDLGEPQLTSVPGFLTKFLFSFFHTLGMQERDDIGDDSGIWVRRFEPNLKTKTLRPTKETSKLLQEAYSAFELALIRIVRELFEEDDSVRWLLLQYVTLQLFSDASFCLQKWTTKGGGRTRDLNHQEGLEKWLWRALWDIYVACDINSQRSLSRLNVKPGPTSTDQVDNNTSSLQNEISLKDRGIALIRELALERATTWPAQCEGRNDGFRRFINAGI